jgi:hypothetical protein
MLVKFPQERYGGESHDYITSNSDVFATISSELDQDNIIPNGPRPLIDPGRRTVIAKSNTSVRVITDGTSVIRRRDGTTEIQWGDPNESVYSLVESESIPQIQTLTGDIPGATEREKVEQRLEALGYK